MRLRSLAIILVAAVQSLHGQNTAKYPAVLPTFEDLLVVANRASTTLTATLSSSGLSISVADGSKFFSPGANEAGTITIGTGSATEHIKYCARSGNTFTVCASGRGFDGSTAVSHASGDLVADRVVAWTHNQDAAEMVALAKSLGPVTTVAGLASLSPADGDMARVTDGATETDCVTGGGSEPVLCMYDLGAAAWEAISGAGGGGVAPATATYITQTPDGTLSAEQALSLLITGILKSTTSTGVVSIAVDADFPSSLARDSELHNQSHVLSGGDHTATGLTTGNVVRASGATSFAWAQLQHGDLGGVGGSDHHAPTANTDTHVDIEENDASVQLDPTTLDFLGADFDLSAAAAEVEISIAAILSRDNEAPAAGDVTGSLSAGYQVTDDSHGHTGSSISALDAGVDITAGLLALARGGTAANLSATGGANQFVRQSGAGSAFTVSAIADGDIPASLTRDTEWDTLTELEAALSYDFSDASLLDTGAIPAARVGAGHIDALTELSGGLCGTGEIMEDQGASWACITTPVGGGAHNILSATHTDSVTASVVRGDIVLGNATPAWDRLAIGSANQVLATNATDPAWTTLAKAHLPAAIAYEDEANIFTLAGGITTDNQLGVRLRELTANGTNYIEHRSVADAGAGNTTYTWPVSLAGFLRSTAGGVLSWNSASGIGACAANNAATTLNDNAAPTCAEFTALGQTIDLAAEVTGELPDANVANNITLANLTQITTRLISDTSGTLAVGRGGTGVTAPTDGGLLLGSGAGALTSLGVASNGQIPIGDGATDPVLANITAEAGGEISVTNGAGTIVLDVVEANLDLSAIGGTLGTSQADAAFILAAEIDTFSELNTLVADATLSRSLFHATDCTGLTNGIEGDLCWEQDANTVYACEPSAGGCDTAGEWIPISGGSAEINDLEADDPPNVEDNEVYVGTGAGAGAWIPLNTNGAVGFNGTNFGQAAIEGLSDVTAKTGTGTVIVFQINPTFNDLVVNDLLTFTETAGDATCGAGDYWIKGNSTSGKSRGCENGTLFDVSGGAGSTQVRYIQFEESAVSTSGSPADVTFDNVTTIQLPNAADSEINAWFRVPPDAVVANDILLVLNFAPNAAPGPTNNKVKLKITARVDNTSASQTAGDVITLANDTDWASYTATLNIVAGTTYAVGDLVQMKILRDTSVANNAAVGFNIAKIAWTYTSSQ